MSEKDAKMFLSVKKLFEKNMLADERIVPLNESEEKLCFGCGVILPSDSKTNLCKKCTKEQNETKVSEGKKIYCEECGKDVDTYTIEHGGKKMDVCKPCEDKVMEAKNKHCENCGATQPPYAKPEDDCVACGEFWTLKVKEAIKDDIAKIQKDTEKIKKIRKEIEDGSLEEAKPILKRRPKVDLKSVLTPIVTKVKDMHNVPLDHVKDFVESEISQQDIDRLERQKMINTISSQRDFRGVLTYLYNALLKYEGFGVDAGGGRGMAEAKESGVLAGYKITAPSSERKAALESLVKEYGLEEIVKALFDYRSKVGYELANKIGADINYLKKEKVAKTETADSSHRMTEANEDQPQFDEPDEVVKGYGIYSDEGNICGFCDNPAKWALIEEDNKKAGPWVHLCDKHLADFKADRLEESKLSESKLTQPLRILLGTNIYNPTGTMPATLPVGTPVSFEIANDSTIWVKYRDKSGKRRTEKVDKIVGGMFDINKWIASITESKVNEARMDIYNIGDVSFIKNKQDLSQAIYKQLEKNGVQLGNASAVIINTLLDKVNLKELQEAKANEDKRDEAEECDVCGKKLAKGDWRCNSFSLGYCDECYKNNAPDPKGWKQIKEPKMNEGKPASDFFEEMDRVREVVEEYIKYNIADKSYPSAPDTSKFTATSGGWVKLVKNSYGGEVYLRIGTSYPKKKELLAKLEEVLDKVRVVQSDEGTNFDTYKFKVDNFAYESKVNESAGVETDEDGDIVIIRNINGIKTFWNVERKQWVSNQDDATLFADRETVGQVFSTLKNTGAENPRHVSYKQSKEIPVDFDDEELHESKLNEQDEEEKVDAPEEDSNIPPNQKGVEPEEGGATPDPSVDNEEDKVPDVKRIPDSGEEKEYLGAKGSEQYFYIKTIYNDSDQVDDLLIVDASGNELLSAKEAKLNLEDIVGFILEAIKIAEITLVSTDIVEKYIIVPEEEKEEAAEEDIPQEVEAQAQEPEVSPPAVESPEKSLEQPAEFNG